jgi:hypothetical protein
MQWKHNDPVFSEQCQRARVLGAETFLHEAEQKQQDAYARAIDEACNPVLATMSENIMKHARWKASKYAPKDFGDSVHTKNSYVGKDGEPVDPPSAISVKDIEILKNLGIYDALKAKGEHND